MNHSLLIQALSDSDFGTDDGELAYLALTSKVELPFRDRLALSLRARVAGAMVAREWKERVDLAILSTSRIPTLLVELKSLHVFDLLSAGKRQAFSQAVAADRRKLERFVKKHNFVTTENYVLVLVTACQSVPDNKYEGIVKYRKAIAGCRSMTGEEINSQIKECFGTDDLLAVNQVSAGEAFGVSVRIHYALYRVSQEA